MEYQCDADAMKDALSKCLIIMTYVEHFKPRVLEVERYVMSVTYTMFTSACHVYVTRVCRLQTKASQNRMISSADVVAVIPRCSFLYSSVYVFICNVNEHYLAK